MVSSLHHARFQIPSYELTDIIPCGFQTGLLAGLHEFPTRANVSGALASTSAQTKICHTILTELLQSPVIHAGSADSSSTSVSKSSNDAVRISDIQQAGDVVHVFSHIRKTYRVQWVVLEGGTDPPQLTHTSRPSTKNSANRKRKASGKIRGKKDVLNAVGSSDRECDEPVSSVAKWIPLNEVADAKYAFKYLHLYDVILTARVVSEREC